MIKKLILTLSVLVISTSSFAKTWNLEVTGEMTYNAKFYTNMGILQNVNTGDIIIIRINSPGGYTAVLREYVAALKTKSVYVVTETGDLAASAAAMLVCVSDERHINNNTKILFHMPYYTVIKGKTAVNYPANQWERDYVVNTINNYCKDMVSNAIINKMVFNDYQYWTTGREMNRVKLR